MPQHLITLTVTPFLDFSVLLFAAQIPACAPFAVTFGPREMIKQLGAWSPPQQAVGLFLIKPSHETMACVQFSVGNTDLGHLHFKSPSLEPQLLSHLDASHQWGMQLRLHVTLPFASTSPPQAER